MFAWIFFFFFSFLILPHTHFLILWFFPAQVPSFVLWSFSCVNLYNGKYCSVWIESMENLKKKAEIQIEEIYFCVKLFKNSVLYKRQKVLCTWCEYANTAIIKIDCMEKSYQDSFSSTITFDNVSSQGSDSSSGNAETEKCAFGFMSITAGWVEVTCMESICEVVKMNACYIVPAALLCWGQPSVQCWRCPSGILWRCDLTAPLHWLSWSVCSNWVIKVKRLVWRRSPYSCVFQLFWHNVQIHFLWEHECTETYIFETVHCVLYCFFFKNAGYPSELISFMWFHDLKFERPLE